MTKGEIIELHDGSVDSVWKCFAESPLNPGTDEVSDLMGLF